MISCGDCRHARHKDDEAIECHKNAPFGHWTDAGAGGLDWNWPVLWAWDSCGDYSPAELKPRIEVRSTHGSEPAFLETLIRAIQSEGAV